MILGLLFPLVIHADPFGDTDIGVYNLDFLPAPDAPQDPAVEPAPVPDWVPENPTPVELSALLVPNFVLEILS